MLHQISEFPKIIYKYQQNWTNSELNSNWAPIFLPCKKETILDLHFFSQVGITITP